MNKDDPLSLRIQLFPHSESLPARAQQSRPFVFAPIEFSLVPGVLLKIGRKVDKAKEPRPATREQRAANNVAFGHDPFAVGFVAAAPSNPLADQPQEPNPEQPSEASQQPSATYQKPNEPSAAASSDRRTLFLAFRSKVVSRSHAEISVNKDGQIFFRDVGSSSGSFLNRLRLSPSGKESRPYQIRSGDIIQLGVDYQGKAEEIYKAVLIRIFVSVKSGVRVHASSIRLRSAIRSLIAAMNPNNPDPEIDLQTDPAAASAHVDCCICLYPMAPLQAIFLAPCSHCFHYRCVTPLLGVSGLMFQCPLCRQVANLDASVATDFDSESLSPSQADQLVVDSSIVIERDIHLSSNPDDIRALQNAAVPSSLISSLLRNQPQSPSDRLEASADTNNTNNARPPPTDSEPLVAPGAPLLRPRAGPRPLDFSDLIPPPVPGAASAALAAPPPNLSSVFGRTNPSQPQSSVFASIGAFISGAPTFGSGIVRNTARPNDALPGSGQNHRPTDGDGGDAVASHLQARSEQTPSTIQSNVGPLGRDETSPMDMGTLGRQGRLSSRNSPARGELLSSDQNRDVTNDSHGRQSESVRTHPSHGGSAGTSTAFGDQDGSQRPSQGVGIGLPFPSRPDGLGIEGLPLAAGSSDSSLSSLNSNIAVAANANRSGDADIMAGDQLPQDRATDTNNVVQGVVSASESARASVLAVMIDPSMASPRGTDSLMSMTPPTFHRMAPQSTTTRQPVSSTSVREQEPSTSGAISLQPVTASSASLVGHLDDAQIPSTDDDVDTRHDQAVSLSTTHPINNTASFTQHRSSSHDDDEDDESSRDDRVPTLMDIADAVTRRDRTAINAALDRYANEISSLLQNMQISESAASSTHNAGDAVSSDEVEMIRQRFVDMFMHGGRRT